MTKSRNNEEVAFKPAPPEGAESSMPALRCERLQGLDIPSRSRLDLTNLALPEFIRG